MARRGLTPRDEEDIELNMTPMLDVVFILLIFFIVTAVFVKEPGIDPDRPDVTSLEDVRPTILIGVSNDDDIWIDGDLVPPAELTPRLISLRSENPKAEAIIQADETARFEVVYRVMEALQEVGVPQQWVSAEPD
ncbi:MAG: biopolymer transporter ExbD [Maricaulaceae bacterium]|jgi:biopolymer transport protein ExbD